MQSISYSGMAKWEASHFHQTETKSFLAKDENQDPDLPRPRLSVCPKERNIGCTQNDSKLTSIGNIELDSKISIGSSWVVAGCQNDPTDGFDLSNDAWYSRCGEDSILSNNQSTNLGEEIQNTHFSINKSRAITQWHQNS